MDLFAAYAKQQDEMEEMDASESSNPTANATTAENLPVMSTQASFKLSIVTRSLHSLSYLGPLCSIRQRSCSIPAKYVFPKLSLYTIHAFHSATGQQ